jgi:polysaccharide biosynthesis transport protein
MNDIEVVPHRPPQLGPPLGPPTRIALDIPGVGLKQDYAGLLEYWQIARRHKGVIILATFLGGVLGFLLTLSAPRIYQASLTMEIQGINDEFLNMRNVNPTADSNASPDMDLQTHVKILQSKLLSDRARQKLLQGQKRPDDLRPTDRLGMWRKALNANPPAVEDLWYEAVDTAASSVRVRSAGINRIVDVSCDSTNAQVAADFCNTLASEYIEQNLESRWLASERTGEWLTKQLRDLKIELEKSEEELQSYARKTGLIFTGEKNDVQEATLTALQGELSQAQADRIAKQSRFEMVSASPLGTQPEVLDNESLGDSQAALAPLRAKLAELKVVFTANHAEVRQVEAQIVALQAAQQETRASIKSRISQEFEAAKRREALLTKAYTTQANAMSGKAEETAHYSLLRREVEASRLLYENLAQKLKEASLASALRANNIRVVDAAERAGGPYKPNVRQRAMLGLLGGFVVGIAFIVLREQADRTLQDPGDVTYHLALPELGVVPIGNLLDSPDLVSRSKPVTLFRGGGPSDAPPAAGRVEMVSFRDKSSLLAESFRTTLTSILFSRQSGDRPRMLVFTSASPKEGKTTTVCNLGIALAEIKHSVLVIDADMRRPRLHSVFDVANDHGLSDLLLSGEPLGAKALVDACVATVVPGLFVLPSGGSRRSASTLLHSARLEELLQLARERFDTVIVDTPPMVNIADARVVARFGDAVILIVRSGVTTRDAALLAKSRFAEDGIPVLGAILNCWNPKTPGYGYYKHYYAGYYHYYGKTGGGSDDTDAGDDGEPPSSDRQRRPAGARSRTRPQPQLQFLASIDDAVAELERHRAPSQT